MECSLAESFNIAPSTMKALDFCIDIDEEDLLPPEDLRISGIKGNGSEIKMKPTNKLQFQGKNQFDQVRKSNPTYNYRD